MLCEGISFFPENTNYCYHALQITKFINAIVSIRTIINGNVNVICYDLEDFIPPCLQSILHHDYNTLSPLHIPMK